MEEFWIGLVTAVLLSAILLGSVVLGIGLVTWAL